jgi:hypothetical protein
MTHIHDMPDILAEVVAFREKMAEHFITFDPGDVDEKLLADQALQAAKEGRTFIEVPSASASDQAAAPSRKAKTETRKSAPPARLRLKVADILTILPDVDGQIYSRDFLLVRQSDMVVSYIPELPPTAGAGSAGKPGLSSGVERELQHAHDHGRETFVIWKPAKDPSPFITQTATKVFRSTDEALSYFDTKGYLRPHTLFGS